MRNVIKAIPSWLLLILMVFALAVTRASAQPGPFTPLIFTAANPDGTVCSSSSPLRYYTATNTVYGCSSGAYAAISGGGGGGGSLVMTTGTGAPSANCTAPSSSNLAVYFDTTGQDQWFCYAANSWKKVYAGVPGAYVVTGTTGTAPSNPASGSVTCYYSSVSNTQICLDTSGNAFTMVAAVSCSAGNHISAISAAGIGTCTADTPAAATANVPFTPMAWILGLSGAPIREQVPTANMIFQRFPVRVGGTFTTASIVVETAVSSSHIVVGVYSAPCGSGTTLVSQATFDSSTTGAKQVSLSVSLPISGNAEYYLGISADTAGVYAYFQGITAASVISLYNAGSTKYFSTGNVTLSGTTAPANCGTLTASTTYDASMAVLWP